MTWLHPPAGPISTVMIILRYYHTHLIWHPGDDWCDIFVTWAARIHRSLYRITAHSDT